MQTVITLALKEIYAYVFTNKSVNCDKFSADHTV